MNHPKTTTLGLLTIAVALFATAKQYISGQTPDFGTLAAQVATGVGLITAADGGKLSGE